MTKLIVIVGLLSPLTACVVEPEDAELATTEQASTPSVTGSFRTSFNDMPGWLAAIAPKKKLCEALNGKSFSTTLGDCTITHTLSNCHYNSSSGDCDCTETETRGPGC